MTFQKVSDIISTIDLDKAIQMMQLLEKIKKNKPLDILLEQYPFGLVYGVVKSHSVKDRSKGINATLSMQCVALYLEICEKYPIDKFPEKYI